MRDIAGYLRKLLSDNWSISDELPFIVLEEFDPKKPVMQLVASTGNDDKQLIDKEVLCITQRCQLNLLIRPHQYTVPCIEENRQLMFKVMTEIDRIVTECNLLNDPFGTGINDVFLTSEGWQNITVDTGMGHRQKYLRAMTFIVFLYYESVDDDLELVTHIDHVEICNEAGNLVYNLKGVSAMYYENADTWREVKIPLGKSLWQDIGSLSAEGGLICKSFKHMKTGFYETMVDGRVLVNMNRNSDSYGRKGECMLKVFCKTNTGLLKEFRVYGFKVATVTLSDLNCIPDKNVALYSVKFHAEQVHMENVT